MKQIAYKHPNIKFICGSEVVAEKLVKDSYVPMKNIYVLTPSKWFDLGALKVKLEELRIDIYKAADEEFNINSTQQLGKILFEKLSIDVSKFPLFVAYENGRCIGTSLIYNI